MLIKDHRLIGENIIQIDTPKNKVKFKPGNLDTIIMHYTAGASAESSVNTLSNPNVKASAHIVIGRDGTVYQLVSFNTIAWHAGRSQYEGRVGFNNYSIGIELDNPGKLEKTEAGYQTWYGADVVPNNVIKAVHRNRTQADYWHTYTSKQIQQAELLSKLLIDTYDIKLILGHEEVSPGRKIDPGPAFPLDKFKGKLLNANRAEDGKEEVNDKTILKVDANFLNVRSGPGANHEQIHEPLKKGTKLRLVEQKGKWAKVKFEQEGWVHSDYIS